MSDLKEQHPEVPVIVIERDDEPVKASITPSANGPSVGCIPTLAWPLVSVGPSIAG